VAILLNYGTARVLLAIDAEAKEEYMPNDPTRGPKRSSTFRNYTHSEPRFRALLTESGDPHVRFSREVFKRYSKALP
jgi:hypothetical protein